MNPQQESTTQNNISPAMLLKIVLGGSILYFGAIVIFAHLFTAMF